MLYICEYCVGMFDHDPIPISRWLACPFCKRESYGKTDPKTKKYEELPTLREATKTEVGYFKSDAYSPPEILCEDKWEDNTEFIEDYEPFWEERYEDGRDLEEPLHKVMFSDDYEGSHSDSEDDNPFEWVDTDSQAFAPKSRTNMKKKKAS